MTKLAVSVSAGLVWLSVAHPVMPVTTDLDWMSGHWCGRMGADFIEERWLPARGGMLIGVGRTTRGARTLEFEFMRVVLAPDGQPSYIAQPNGGPAVEFKRVSGGADWVRFENPAHDFPTQVEYRRTGNHLHAHIAGPGDGSKQKVINFEYDRCR